jgi:hypothetical protein
MSDSRGIIHCCSEDYFLSGMTRDSQQALFAQFARFCVNQSMDYEDWEAIAAEGTVNLAENRRKAA